jgi:hypothetical protein
LCLSWSEYLRGAIKPTMEYHSFYFISQKPDNDIRGENHGSRGFCP